MRRSRRLTTAERWELGLFLSLLIVTCLCLASVLNLNGVPRMFAAGSIVDASAALSPVAPQQEQVLPQMEAAPAPR